MHNPTTQHPISEAMPLVNALINEAERNAIDLSAVDVVAHTSGRFRISITAYSGGAHALARTLGLHPDVIFTSHRKTFQGVSRTIGRWTVSSYYPLDVKVAAA